MSAGEVEGLMKVGRNLCSIMVIEVVASKILPCIGCRRPGTKGQGELRGKV